LNGRTSRAEAATKGDSLTDTLGLTLTGVSLCSFEAKTAKTRSDSEWHRAWIFQAFVFWGVKAWYGLSTGFGTKPERFLARFSWALS